jgi:hypothetical protein
MYSCNRFGRFLGFRQHHPDALGTLQQFDHQRGATDHLDDVGDIVRFARVPG